MANSGTVSCPPEGTQLLALSAWSGGAPLASRAANRRHTVSSWANCWNVFVPPLSTNIVGPSGADAQAVNRAAPSKPIGYHRCIMFPTVSLFPRAEGKNLATPRRIQCRRAGHGTPPKRAIHRPWDHFPMPPWSVGNTKTQSSGPAATNSGSMRAFLLPSKTRDHGCSAVLRRWAILPLACTAASPPARGMELERRHRRSIRAYQSGRCQRSSAGGPLGAAGLTLSESVGTGFAERESSAAVSDSAETAGSGSDASFRTAVLA